MQLIQLLGEKAEIQFSINEITVLNNSLNELCHGVEIVDFVKKIGVTHEEAKNLLNPVNDLMNELRLQRQENKNSQMSIAKPNTSLNIKEKCYLVASGYQITFYIKSLDSSRQYIGLIAALVVSTEFEEFSLKSAAQKILIQDLQNLTEYFEQHIASLRKNLFNNSSTFLNCQNSFQVQALSGNITSENEESFTLRFMINVGHQKERGHTSTYVGAEAVVTVKNIQDFTASIQTALAKLAFSN